MTGMQSFLQIYLNRRLIDYTVETDGNKCYQSVKPVENQHLLYKNGFYLGKTHESLKAYCKCCRSRLES